MYLRSFLLGNLFLLTLLCSHAQNEVEIKGRVVNQQTRQPVPFVNVINYNTKEVVASDTEGFFSTTITTNDTLIFSAIGYERYFFSLHDDDLETIELTIHLNTKTMELEPVDIFAYRDEKALKKAIVDLNIPLEKKFKIELPDPKTLNKDQEYGGGWYSPYEGALERTTIGFTIAKDGIISNFVEKNSKKGKEKAKHNAIVKKQNAIDQKFSRKWIQEVTSLKPEQIESFVLFCKIDDEFIELSSQYEITVAVLNCLKEFNKQDTIQE